MKQLLMIAAGVILLILVPLLLWRLWDNPLERKVTPLVGEWVASVDRCTTLGIRVDKQGGCITVLRKGAPRTTYALHYDNCLYYIAGGQRIDLFFSPTSDVLLLMPGGTFRRLCL